MPKKQSSSSIKMFELLRLLYDNKAEYTKVKKFLAKNDGSDSKVVINKYLNTLKIFGINVKKIGKNFTISSSPYNFNFEKTDLKAIIMVQNALEFLPKSKMKDELEEFLNNLFIRMDANSKTYIESIKKTEYKDLRFYYSQFEEQINLCEKLCEEGQVVELTYQSKDNVTETVTGTPVELDFSGYKILFVIKGKKSKHSIPFDSIIAVNQLPTKSTDFNYSYNVIFRLKEKLAKAYRLRVNEEVLEKKPDGSIVIVNKNEDEDELLSRLMHYQSECEIISPKSFKEKMYNKISKTLALYND